MTTQIDHILDRRGLRKKLTFWRVMAILALGVALVAAFSAAGVFSNLAPKTDHIARVPISGVISEDRKLLKLLKTIKDDKTVKGVVLAIDSPGGTTVGGEAIFNAVREIAEDKPVAASVGTLAASAGYMIATASDHIVARRSSIVGSIGVIIQYPQASGLLDKIGVQMKEVKSSPLKAEPSPFHDTSPEAVAMLQRLIDDSYNWFVDLITDRRPLTRPEVLRLADGSVYSGGRSKDLKLIDAIGDEQTAKSWLVDEKGLSKDLKFVEWKVREERGGLLFSNALMRWFTGEPLDLKSIDPDDLPAFVPRRLFLDGLLSIWHG